MHVLPLLLSSLHMSPDNFAGTSLNGDSLSPSFDTTGLSPSEDLMSRIIDRYRPSSFHHFWPWFSPLEGPIIATPSIENNNFKLTVPVRKYKPEDITVNVRDYRWIIIKGNHSINNESGKIEYRQICISQLLPDRADGDKVTAIMSSNGILTIIAPLKPKNEREIKIEYVAAESPEGASAPSTTEKIEENNEVTREKETATQDQGTAPNPEK